MAGLTLAAAPLQPGGMVVEDPRPRGRLLEAPALALRLDAFEHELRALAGRGKPAALGAEPLFAHLEELSAALNGLVERVERLQGR